MINLRTPFDIRSKGSFLLTRRSIKDRPGSAYLSIGAEITSGVSFKGTMVKVETIVWKGHGSIS